MGYVTGTIPSADLAARAASGGAIDLRTEGSGNPGAANAARVLGRGWGAMVMAADITKGALACATGRAVADELGAHVAGTFAVAGHCFPVWNGFRGGKGVATGAGQYLATFPASLPVALAGAAGARSIRRGADRARAMTAAAAVGWVTAAFVWWRKGWRTGTGVEATPALVVAAVATSALVLGRFTDAAPSREGVHSLRATTNCSKSQLR